LITECNYGVQLFFVVSALTLFMSLETRLTRERHPIRAFYIRRLFRIAPMFWLSAIVYLWQSGMGPRDSAPDGITWYHVIATLCFLHGWHPTSINSVVPGGWSIAVEMNFYLVLPICFYVFKGLRRGIIGCIVTLLVTVGISVATRRWLYEMVPFDQHKLIDNFTYYWLPRQFAVFTLGFVLFSALKVARAHVGPGNSTGPNRLIRWLPCVALIVLVFLTLAGDRIPLGYFTSSCAFTLLAFTLAYRPIRILVNPVTCFVGKVSFSAYLCHFLVVSLIAKVLAPNQSAWGKSPVGFPVCYLIVALVTVTISSITYRFVEVPGQLVGRTLINRLGYGRATET
jgi:peptidoglycan/LPS O-acetylase OafA/YrhL